MRHRGPPSRRHGSDGELGYDLLKGALAGLVATWVLDRVDWYLYDREPEHSRRRTWAVRPEHKDPAHYIASRASVALGGPPIPQDHPAGIAVHYAIGVAPAALYAAIRERFRAVGAAYGLGYGLAMWVLEDEIVNPAMGAAAPPHHYPWRPHARGLVAHLAYGMTTEVVLRALDSTAQEHARRRRAWR